MMDDPTLTTEEMSWLSKRLDELRVQAMMFDMDIDYETLSLMPKHKDTTPIWLKIWKEKVDASDSRLYDFEH